MKKVCWLIGIVLVVFMSVALASDVADIAKKEKERREKTKDPNKTFTNQDVDEFKKKNKIEDSESVEGEEEEASSGASEPSIPSDQDPSSVDYWQKKAGEAQAKVDAAQAKLDRIQDDINKLQLATGAYGSGQEYGSGQTTSGTDPLDILFEERGKIQADLDSARAELEGVQNDARQAGIPDSYTASPEKEEPEPVATEPEAQEASETPEKEK